MIDHICIETDTDIESGIESGRWLRPGGGEAQVIVEREPPGERSFSVDGRFLVHGRSREFY